LPALILAKTQDVSIFFYLTDIPCLRSASPIPSASTYDSRGRCWGLWQCLVISSAGLMRWIRWY